MRFRPLRWLGFGTITGKLVVIVLAFITVFAAVLGLFTLSYGINTGIRAYVGGEGLWSKGQKDAVFHLTRYVITGAASDYQDYEASIALPLGDAEARRQMERPQPEASVVRAGFVAGGNAPEDVPYMAALFRYAGQLPFFAQAIRVWREAEKELLALPPLAAEIRARRARGALTPRQQDDYLARIHAINERVTPLEQQFSQLLASGAREVQALLLLVTLATASALLALSALFAWSVSRNFRRDIAALSDGVQRVAMGVMTQPIPVRSHDELGELAEAFNAMTSARRRAEAALVSANEFREKVMENASNAIYTLDLEGRFTTANRRTCEITGYPLRELIGMKWPEMIAPEELPALQAGFDSTVTGGERMTQREARVRRKDGEWISIIFSIAPLSRDGEVFAVVGAAEDITVRQRAELDLKARAEELSRSNRELEQFAYVASHDLQEPLRTVSGFADLLNRRYQGKLGAEADEYVGFITSGVTRMKSLIEDLLAYSRVQKLELPPVPVPLDSALDTALANLHGTIAANTATIEREPLPTVSADARQMAQLFQNLIANAIKFRREEPPRVRINAVREGREWRIRVVDNGIGIDAGSAERVFVLFQRLHTRDQYEGNGIGLTICKKIVELHGGHIRAVPRGDGERGAVFEFTLPEP